jgi:MFS family permease
MFFLMSFALIHGLDESARLAGLKLAVIPVAIGATAPLSAGLAARWGHRVVTAGGMLLCAAAVVAVAVIALKPAGTLLQGLGAFALFGIGLGLFIGPNSHATTEAAPADRSSEAGALLNLSRVLGSCIGVSSASTLMSLRMGEADTALATLFSGLHMLAAIEASLVLIAGFALTAAALSLFKPGKSA